MASIYLYLFAPYYTGLYLFSTCLVFYIMVSLITFFHSPSTYVLVRVPTFTYLYFKLFVFSLLFLYVIM